MKFNQNCVFEQNQKRLMRDFWFITAVVVINFLMFALGKLFEVATIRSYSATIVGVFWFPATFALIGIYGTVFWFGFLDKRLGAIWARVISFIMIALIVLIALFLLICIIGTGHGAPLEFLYQKHLASLIIFSAVLIIPYAFIIIKIIKNKKKYLVD